jgi:hypothetical protein
VNPNTPNATMNRTVTSSDWRSTKAQNSRSATPKIVAA